MNGREEGLEGGETAEGVGAIEGGGVGTGWGATACTNVLQSCVNNGT